MKIRVVSWNNARWEEPWRWFLRMAEDGKCHIRKQPVPLAIWLTLFEDEDQVYWNRLLYDR